MVANSCISEDDYITSYPFVLVSIHTSIGLNSIHMNQIIFPTKIIHLEIIMITLIIGEITGQDYYIYTNAISKAE